MADVFDRETRSRVMRAIRSSGTKPEVRLQQALRDAGIAFGEPSERLPGRPDVVIAEARLAVFVHGCFWHLCPRHYKPPSSAGWRTKMDANRRRDVRVRRKLRALGWRTTVVWEHEAPAAAARRIARRIQRRH